MNTQLKSRPTTIVWGGLLLAVAAIAILATTGGFDGAGPSTVLWLVVGVGGVLVLGALVGGIVRAATRTAPAAPTPAPLDRFFGNPADPEPDSRATTEASARNSEETDSHQPID